MAEKKCTKCGQILPLTEFYKSSGRWLMGCCKSCHVARTRLSHQEYQVRNRESIRVRARAFRAKYPEKIRAYSQKWREADLPRAMLIAARRRAKITGVECTIKREDILIPTRCPVLGIPFGPHTGRGQRAFSDSPSLDRIDNSKGYIPGNVQVVSHKANSMKNNATVADLLAFADWVRRAYA